MADYPYTELKASADGGAWAYFDISRVAEYNPGVSVQDVVEATASLLREVNPTVTIVATQYEVVATDVTPT